MSLKSWFDSLNIWVKLFLTFTLIIFYPIGMLFLIAYIVSWARSGKSKSIIQKLNDYLEQKSKLKEAAVRLILQRDERILCSNFSDFYEERAIRDYARTGHSIRIARGWWYHIGSGQAESHGELRKIDSGILYVTNKRFIFNGTFKNYTYTHNKLLSIEPFTDSIRIAVDGRQKTLAFTTGNPLLLGASLEILSESTGLEKEAKEYLEKELKLKMAEKVKLTEGTWTFNVNTYEEMSQAFKLLSQCIKLDIQEYSKLQKTPSDVLSFETKIHNLAKLLENFDSELKKIKHKVGDSAKKSELEAEFDNVIEKKYGDGVLRNAVSDISNSISALGVGEATLTYKENKKNKN